MRKGFFVTCVVTIVSISGCSMMSQEPNEPLVRLSPFEVGYEDKEPVLTMNAEGQMSSKFDGLLGRLSEGGAIYNRNDELVARILPDGELETVTGERLVVVKPDGRIEKGDVSLYWSEEGHYMKDGQDMGLRLIPADSEARTAAALFVYLFFTPTGTPATTKTPSTTK